MTFPALLIRRPFFTVAATLVLGAALSAPLWCRGDDAGTQTPALVGKPAPDFTLETIDGKKITLSELKGNVVVVDFWATWCVPCRVSLPHIQHLGQDKDLADKGLKVLAVNFQDEKDKIAAFLEKNKLAALTVPMDSEGKADESFQVSGYPTTFVIGRDGTIKNGWTGFVDKTAKEIDDAVAAALKEPAPSGSPKK